MRSSIISILFVHHVHSELTLNWDNDASCYFVLIFGKMGFRMVGRNSRAVALALIPLLCGASLVLIAQWNIAPSRVQIRDVTQGTPGHDIASGGHGFERNDSRGSETDTPSGGQRADGIYERLSKIDVSDRSWMEKVDVCFRYDQKKTPVDTGMLDALECRRRVPSALVAGVKKCGTGTMSRYLDLHPAVSMSKEVPIPRVGSANDDSITTWTQSMPFSGPLQLPMTENPAFLFNRALPKLEAYLPSDVKFISMLREPLGRAVSDYLHALHFANVPSDEVGRPFTVKYKSFFIRETFEKTVVNPTSGSLLQDHLLLTRGLYLNLIKPLLSVYRRDQFLFVDGDDFARDPFPTMLQVESFLGLPRFYKRSHFVLNETRGFYCAHVPERPDFGCMIPTKGRLHPNVSEDISNRLKDYYRESNRGLVDEIGLDFPWLHME